MGGEFTYQPKWDPKTVLTTTAISGGRCRPSDGQAEVSQPWVSTKAGAKKVMKVDVVHQMGRPRHVPAGVHAGAGAGLLHGQPGRRERRLRGRRRLRRRATFSTAPWPCLCRVDGWKVKEQSTTRSCPFNVSFFVGRFGSPTKIDYWKKGTLSTGGAR